MLLQHNCYTFSTSSLGVQKCIEVLKLELNTVGFPGGSLKLGWGVSPYSTLAALEYDYPQAVRKL